MPTEPSVQHDGKYKTTFVKHITNKPSSRKMEAKIEDGKSKSISENYIINENKVNKSSDNANSTSFISEQSEFQSENGTYQSSNSDFYNSFIPQPMEEQDIFSDRIPSEFDKKLETEPKLHHSESHNLQFLVKIAF